MKAFQTVSPVCHFYAFKMIIFQHRFCSIRFDTKSTKSKTCPFACVAHCAVSAIIGFPLLALKSQRIPSRSPVSSIYWSSNVSPFSKKHFIVSPNFYICSVFSMFLNRRNIEFRIRQLLYVFTGARP